VELHLGIAGNPMPLNGFDGIRVVAIQVSEDGREEVPLPAPESIAVYRHGCGDAGFGWCEVAFDWVDQLIMLEEVISAQYEVTWEGESCAWSSNDVAARRFILTQEAPLPTGIGSLTTEALEVQSVRVQVGDEANCTPIYDQRLEVRLPVFITPEPDAVPWLHATQVSVMIDGELFLGPGPLDIEPLDDGRFEFAIRLNCSGILPGVPYLLDGQHQLQLEATLGGGISVSSDVAEFTLDCPAGEESEIGMLAAGGADGSSDSSDVAATGGSAEPTQNAAPDTDGTAATGKTLGPVDAAPPPSTQQQSPPDAPGCRMGGTRRCPTDALAWLVPLGLALRRRRRVARRVLVANSSASCP
jgi:hypothetical protein